MSTVYGYLKEVCELHAECERVPCVRLPTRKLGCSNLLVTILLRVDVWPGVIQIEVPAPSSSSVDCELEQCLSVCLYIVL